VPAVGASLLALQRTRIVHICNDAARRCNGARPLADASKEGLPIAGMLK